MNECSPTLSIFPDCATDFPQRRWLRPFAGGENMVTAYDLKPAFQRLLSPVTQALAARGVHPNTVTGAAIAISVSTGILVSFYAESPFMLLVLAVAMVVRLALNAIDGELARATGRTSRHGAVLNFAVRRGALSAFGASFRRTRGLGVDCGRARYCRRGRRNDRCRARRRIAPCRSHDET